jgi:hypothetical protein
MPAHVSPQAFTESVVDGVPAVFRRENHLDEDAHLHVAHMGQAL